MGPDAPRIGEKIRLARRGRGMAQETLAGLVGRSKGWMSMVENGRLRIDRRSDIAAIANALEVSATDLLDEPEPVVPIARPRRTRRPDVVRLREMLLDTTLDDPPDMPVRGELELVREMEGPVADARASADYASLAQRLPGLIGELHVAAAQSGEMLRPLVDACIAATFTLRHVGHADLAWIAADRAGQAAVRLGDPVLVGAAAFARAHSRPTASRSRPLRNAARTADAIEPHLADDRLAHEVYGMLHLTGALAAQVNRDSSTATAHADEAERIAARLGERAGAWQSFGPANVGAWRVMLATEAGNPETALRHAANVDTARLPTQGRRAALAIETGRAHAMLDHPRQAIASLRQAERISPARVHSNALVRELVTDLLNSAQRNAGGRDLRGLAWRMGVI